MVTGRNNGEHNVFIEYEMTLVSKYATILLCCTSKDADFLIDGVLFEKCF